MSLSLIILSLVLLYSVASMIYLYRWRGQARYQSVTQYLRKSWPVFAPLNCLLYMTTKAEARKAVVAADYLKNIAVLRHNWTIIKAEALALQATGAFEAIKTPGSVGYYDLGFRTFYKRGWSKFYLMWYGTTHNSALRLCPQTLALLKQVPGIQGAMFSILPPGAELTLHADPMASSLRYHLGLSTPNSVDCFINVDGIQCNWQDGADFVFDETYPHYAKNNSDTSRLILMCDVERPMNGLGRAFNLFYRFLLKGTLVPNTAEDKTGLFSRLFASMAPLRHSALKLRSERRRLYKALKLTLNCSLLALLFAMLFGLVNIVEVFLSAHLSL
jgi:beta-hydroxylase